MKTKLFNKLSTKLIISISVILSLIFAIYTYVTISNLRDDLTRFRMISAYNSSDLIKKSTRYSMLLNRRDDVHQIIKTIGTEDGIIGIRIYNKMGYIAFSTDSSEISTKVSMTDKVCVACHSNSGVIQSLTVQNRIRYFTYKDSVAALGLINPIKNEKDCYTADCHAHDKKVNILGVLDVMVTTKDLDEAISRNTKSTITDSILILIAISLFTGLFVKVIVSKPLGILTEGLKEIGKESMNYKIKIKSRDELGMVAKRFNEMSDRLNEAYNEIKDWNETLNEKVNQKSEELKNIYSQVFQIEKLASLGKLSATVAHELNNPLAGILTYSKLISKKLIEKQQDSEFKNLIEYLDLISGESARCGKIVKDLLLFSHQGKDEFENTDIKPIVERCTTLIKHHLEMNGIKLQINYNQTDQFIKCSPEKIQEALIAMLINSIEAMTNGGTIIIDITNENSKLVIRIIDEGTGISDKDKPHIFEPFYSTKEASKGTGLGLAVVYGIVKQHSGEIIVEKTSLKGTTFKISLPKNI